MIYFRETENTFLEEKAMGLDNIKENNYYVVNFERIEFDKKHPYTVKLFGYIPTFGSNKLYEFKFTGADLETNASLPDKVREKLMKELEKDYGYGMYDKKKVNNQFNLKKQYRILM